MSNNDLLTRFLTLTRSQRGLRLAPGETPLGPVGVQPIEPTRVIIPIAPDFSGAPSRLALLARESESGIAVGSEGVSDEGLPVVGVVDPETGEYIFHVFNNDSGTYDEIDVGGRRVGSGEQEEKIYGGAIRELLPIRLSAVEDYEDAIPQYTWTRPTDSPPNATMLSLHVDQMRWVRVTVFLDREGGYAEIPILDPDGIPYLSPGLPPPKMMVRIHLSNTDRVNDPNATDIAWEDTGCFGRPGSGSFDSPQNIFGCILKQKQDPVPHWVARISSYNETASANQVTVMVDLLGQGYGQHSAAFNEVGSSGTVGHYRVWNKWTTQDFNSAAVLATFNERKYGTGAIFVANDPSVPLTPGQLYLTTGANQGTSTGTALFTDLPMVMVLADQVLNADRTASPQTAWMPESWGMGMGIQMPNTVPTTAIDKAYKTEIRREAASGHYRVDIYNTGGGPGASPSSTRDRTYYVFSIGI